MKKGAYKQLNLTHLEAAQREQWTYETLLDRALAAELEGREQKAIARRRKRSAYSQQKDGGWVRFRVSTDPLGAQTPGTGGSLIRQDLRGRWSSSALPAQGKPISVWHWRTERSQPAIPCCLLPWLNWRKHWRVLRILVSCVSVSGGILLPTWLFIDEVGYTKLSQEQAHHFFELVTARDAHGSIILTSNTSFGQWGNLLGDEVLATALLDRLLHPASVIPINGRSYRMKERQAERTGFSAPPEVVLGATGGKSTGVG